MTKESCAVCDKPAHGIHFGLLSCRACAAFFRRSIVEDRQYVCRRGQKRCTATSGSRLLCKFCRLQRCIELGMTADKVQLNRDIISSTMQNKTKKAVQRPEKPLTPPAVQVQPEFIAEDSFEPIDHQMVAYGNFEDYQQNSFEDDNFNETCHTFVNDLCSTSATIQWIFTSFQPEQAVPEIQGATLLERLALGLRYRRRNQSYDLMRKQFMDLSVERQYWEQQMFPMAEWFMFCPEFVQLSLQDKMVIFKNRRSSWNYLERIQLTLQVFGEDTITDKLLIMDDHHYACLSQLDIRVPVHDNVDIQCVKRMYQTVRDAFVNDIAKPLFDLKLDELEFVYLIGITAFHAEGLSLSEESLCQLIAARDRLSTDISHFYASKQRNYAARLITLLEIVESIEKIQNERKKVTEFGVLFNVLKEEGCHEDECQIVTAL